MIVVLIVVVAFILCLFMVLVNYDVITNKEKHPWYDAYLAFEEYKKKEKEKEKKQFSKRKFLKFKKILRAIKKIFKI